MAAHIVLLHGFTQTGASWRELIAELGERYRAVAPDIRGHGTAATRRPVTLDAVLDDLDALAPPRFTLGGYSMGGRIALHAALRMPAGVERLVLVGASPGIADPDERATRRAEDEALAGELEQGLSIESFAARWERRPLIADQPPSARDDRRRNTPAGLAAALTGLSAGVLPSLWERLPEIAVPVELVVGERDAKFRAIADRMAAALPRARIAVIPDAGHAAHLEAPGLVAAVIEAGQTTHE